MAATAFAGKVPAALVTANAPMAMGANGAIQRLKAVSSARLYLITMYIYIFICVCIFGCLCRSLCTVSAQKTAAKDGACCLLLPHAHSALDCLRSVRRRVYAAQCLCAAAQATTVALAQAALFC